MAREVHINRNTHTNEWAVQFPARIVKMLHSFFLIKILVNEIEQERVKKLLLYYVAMFRTLIFKHNLSVVAATFIIPINSKSSDPLFSPSLFLSHPFHYPSN